MTQAQKNLFGSEIEYRLNLLSNDNIIKSVSYSQTEILSWIIKLYCPDGFDLDPTYSKGNFYGIIPEPNYKLDLFPQKDGCVCAKFEELPIRPLTVKSIVFDPPFVIKNQDRNNAVLGKIESRFYGYPTLSHLIESYSLALLEFNRVLLLDGYLVFKCQDVDNKFIHCLVYQLSIEAGFIPIDLFVLCRKMVILSPNMINQHHARKYHCYFWVFKKVRSNKKLDLTYGKST